MASSAPDSPIPSSRARVLWQLAFDMDVRTPPLALADGLVLSLDRGRRSELRRLALDDGTTRWTRELPHRAHGGPVRTGGALAVPLVNGQVQALRLDDGALWGPAWTLPGPPNPTLGAAGGHFFARCGQGVDAALHALAPGRPAPLWSVPDPLAGADTARLRVTDGVLVLAGALPEADTVVIAGVDPATGRLLWSHREATSRLLDLWAVAGLVDVVTSSGVLGLVAGTGELRSARFGGFPLESACAVGEHLIAMMEGHMGPVLLCFHLVSQRLVGRVSRAMTRLVGAHANEVLVTLINGDPVFYTLPSLDQIDFPEIEALSDPKLTVWSRDVCYVLGADERTLTAVDLDPPRRVA